MTELTITLYKGLPNEVSCTLTDCDAVLKQDLEAMFRQVMRGVGYFMEEEE